MAEHVIACSVGGALQFLVTDQAIAKRDGTSIAICRQCRHVLLRKQDPAHGMCTAGHLPGFQLKPYQDSCERWTPNV